MISKLIFIAVAAAALGVPVRAEDSTKPAAPAGKYVLKKRSVVHLPMGTRAPFLPIGWTKGAAPVAKVGETVVAAPVLDQKSFKLTSILLGSPALAVINGRAYSEGEFVRMPKTTANLRVRVMRISDGAVVLQHDQQVLNVPLQRAELGPKKAEMEYLSEDR
ncbi:MAG TPA: hypothetical protein VF614_12400 [Chthoniobacteraceae bacterium]|jgi:hypothetical protein